MALGRVLVGYLVAGHGVGVAFGGTLRVGSEASKSRAVLSTMGEGFDGSRFKVLYGPSF